MLKKITLLLLALLLTCSCALAQTAADGYEAALELLGQARYEEAADAFEALNAYADAPRYAVYAKTQAAAANGDYEQAVWGLASIESFLDVPLLTSYYTARSLEKIGDYSGALDAYESIFLYKDSFDRALNCYQLQLQQKFVLLA